MHVPVLLAEVVRLLARPSARLYVDGTVGWAGHARGLLEASPAARLVGLDCDQTAVAAAGAALAGFGSRVELHRANFAEMRRVVGGSVGGGRADGVLLDVGVSSAQLEAPGRGFSFSKEGPLDMRMDQTSPLTAGDILAQASEQQLADILRQWGEEPAARAVARALVAARALEPITTTTQLAAIVGSACRSRRPGLHPATLSFQALRIAVNKELLALEAALPAAMWLLRPGGRLGVISFHSLEDRLVKQSFRRMCKQGEATLAHKGVVTAGQAEIAANPRSRSAKLRVLIKA